MRPSFIKKWRLQDGKLRWFVPVVVIALMCASALLTPLAGRSSSADTMSGMQATGQSGSMANCFLPAAAFCDNFSEGPYTGSAVNRGGDLDPAKWSFSRETEAENGGQGAYFAFRPANAQFCQTPLPGVLPDHDSFFCNGTNGTTTQLQGTEDMHWMTAINDGGEYVTIGARALQPFDFAGRTGTVSFMVDAVTEGPHGTWPSLVLADQPINMPHKSNPGVNSPPRNGLQIDWNTGCGQPTPQTTPTGTFNYFPQTTVGMVTLFRDYKETDWNTQSLGSLPCVTAKSDHPNLIQIQISQTSLDVWMSDAVENMQPGMPMTPPTPKHVLHMDASSGFSLNMTRGYLSFEHAQYAASKFGDSQEHTYHWHAIGFDGPTLSADRDYEIPDSLTPNPSAAGTVNIGYLAQGSNIITCCTNGQWITKPSLTFKNVDLTGVDSAYVTFDWRQDSTAAPNLQVRINGNAWHPVITPSAFSYAATNALAAIPVSDLRSGDNVLEFNAPVGGIMANIDLALDPQAGVVTSTTDSSTTTSTVMRSSTSSASSLLLGSTSTAATSSAVTSHHTHTTSATSTQPAATTTAATSSTVASHTHTTSATSTQSATTTVATGSAVTSQTQSSSATSTSASTASATSIHSVASSTTTSTSATSIASAPTLATSAKLTHYMQTPGHVIHITANVQDLTGSLTNGKVQVEVLAPDGTRSFSQSAGGQTLSAGQAGSYQFSWTTPSTPGVYTVSVAVYGSDGTLYSLNKNAATVRVL